MVVAGGPALGPPPGLAVDDRLVIAADGGADRARRCGWPVHHVVGDLDSITAATLAECRRHGALIHRHPADKDATDLELALDLAVAEEATDVVVVLDDGGRLDHLLASVLVLGADRYASVPISGLVGASRVTVVRERHELAGAIDDVVSLLAVGGPALVTTEGLRYPLADDWLEPLSGRGVSNELVAAVATVSVAEGVVIAIQP